MIKAMDGGRGKLESWSLTLGAGGRGVMKAAGGLTLRRGGENSGNGGPGAAKLVTISVVGLSGGEKEKGSMGIGKSCLCNRFVCQVADDYNVDHISVLSQSDFSGRVVNNDHFLYWGAVNKQTEDGMEFNIQVVEQTEFIDDASFKPFVASGKQEPYVRRCASTKLVSAEKLMYICKNQLGLEQEFTEQLMPEGRVSIDAFICVFDVSLVPNRTLEKQVETTAQILNCLIKTKKPVVLVTTKNEEANEIFVREAERLVNRKEFRGMIPIVETSSHENINVENAFFLASTLIDRNRAGRIRVMSYQDASRMRREVLESTQEQFARLVRNEVTDYGASWTVVVKKLSSCPEFQAFVDHFGGAAAQRIFRRHVKKLKDNYLSERVARYLDLLPEALQELFPDLAALHDEDWISVQEKIREHPEFDRWFVEYPEDTTWMEANLFDGDSSEDRIPFDVLDSTEAETVYKNLLNQLHHNQKRLRLRQDFKKLLEDTGCVTPGKALDEVRVLFLGRECFEALSEEEIQNVYDIHQKHLIQRSKRNFQELLLEKADIFYQFRSSPAGTVTHDDILDITEALSEDGRYKALDRLEADRKLLLFQHLGFIHCPLREHCPAYPDCTDSMVEHLVSRRARNSAWGEGDSNKLNIILLGCEDLSGILSTQLYTILPSSQLQHQGQLFNMEFRRISGDVSQPGNAFKTQNFNPQGKSDLEPTFSGCICIYSDSSSLEYIRSSLEKALLSNLEQEDRLPFQGLPMLILFQVPYNIPTQELHMLQAEGQNLSATLHCPYLEYGGQDHHAILDGLTSLVDSIQQRTTKLSVAPMLDQKAAPTPDIRVIVCLLCGDPFNLENILGPLLGSSTCTQTGVRSVLVNQEVQGVERSVEAILSSYHSASDFRDELVHGFILVYSAKRKASLSTLRAFSMYIPELPIQVVAVADSTKQDSTELMQALSIQGSLIAGQLNAHFVCFNLNQPQKGLYQNFFQEVLEKKGEIEKAFALDDRMSGRLDDSGEGTLERPTRRNPLPPPRIDSYNRKGASSLNSRSGSGRSGSGSEIYEKLPDSGDMLSHSDDSDVYSQLDSHDSHNISRGSNKFSDREGKQSSRSRRKPGSLPSDTSPLPSSGGAQNYSPSLSGGGRYPPTGSSGGSSTRTHSTFTPRSVSGNVNVKGSQGIVKADSLNFDAKDSVERSTFFPGWVDDSLLASKRVSSTDDTWGPGTGGAAGSGGGSPAFRGGAFTTGRRGATGRRTGPLPPFPSSKSAVKDLHNLQSGMARMKVSGPGRLSQPGLDSREMENTYAVPRDSIDNNRKQTNEYAQPNIDGQQHPHRHHHEHELRGPHDHELRGGPQHPHEHQHQHRVHPQELIAQLRGAQSMDAGVGGIHQHHGGRGGPPPLPGQHPLEIQHNRGQSFDGGVHSHHQHRGGPIHPIEGTRHPIEGGGGHGRPPKPRSRNRERRERQANRDLSESETDSSSDDYNHPHHHHHRHGPPSKRPPAAGGAKRPRRRRAGAASGSGGNQPPAPAPGGGAAPVTPTGRSLAIPVATPQLPPGASNLKAAVAAAANAATAANSSQQSNADIGSVRAAIEEIEKGGGPPGGGEGKDLCSPMGDAGAGGEQSEKQRRKLEKEEKLRQKEQAKLDKRERERERKEEKEKAKEEKRKEKAEKKIAARAGIKANSVQGNACLEDFRASDTNPVPVFLSKTISFIESQGLDAEGLYRVPGNRAHVDLIFKEYDENKDFSLEDLDIAVNAVATAVKDFFFKRLPPLLSPEHMDSLETVAVIQDKQTRLTELKKLIDCLPKSNYAVLKFIFTHFVRVTEKSKENCMDSKNLAICWWPTLLQYEFGDLNKFETMRPHLEDVVQTLIDQYRHIFCGDEAMAI